MRTIKRRRYWTHSDDDAPQVGQVMVHPRKEWLVIAVEPNDRCRWPHMWDCSVIEVPTGGSREAFTEIRRIARDHIAMEHAIYRVPTTRERPPEVNQQGNTT